MEFLYRTKRSRTGAERTIRFKAWKVSRTTLVKTLVTAGVTALLPVVLKLFIVVGQQLLNNWST